MWKKPVPQLKCQFRAQLPKWLLLFITIVSMVLNIQPGDPWGIVNFYIGDDGPRCKAFIVSLRTWWNHKAKSKVEKYLYYPDRSRTSVTLNRGCTETIFFSLIVPESDDRSPPCLIVWCFFCHWGSSHSDSDSCNTSFAMSSTPVYVFHLLRLCRRSL